ncbi:MAG: ParB/RepB/Spo0J family partition protein [Pseudomonadota bacterium]|nr:ParB/RepB/Spo0J family partition protein [Pseudomonadota bacterium]
MSEGDFKPKKLGRGLSALLGEKPPQKLGLEKNVEISSSVPIEFLEPGEFQPRKRFDEQEIKALAASISERGILQPILVRPKGERSYEIIAGERRWRAAQIARLREVPILVKDLSNEVVLEAALVENIQRSDLGPLEEAAGYKRLLDEFGYTQDKLARVIGKSRPHIANTLRLVSLPAPVKMLLEEGKLTAGHARSLIGLPNAVELAQEIASKGLSVRQAEALASKNTQKKPLGAVSRGKRDFKDPNTVALEQSLTNLLGLRVSIATNGDRGKLSISFNSLEQLNSVLERLNGAP